MRDDGIGVTRHSEPTHALRFALLVEVGHVWEIATSGQPLRQHVAKRGTFVVNRRVNLHF